MEFLQKMSRSLMIPVAVMPAAAILYRIGKIEFENDFINGIASVFLAGGSVIFDNIPLLFAVGIAIGLSSGHGVAALSAVVGYLVFDKVVKTFNVIGVGGEVIEELNTGVLGGILIGIITSYLYNKFHNIMLPQALGFFSGKRFVPIVTSFVTVIVGVIVGSIWLPIQTTISVFGMWIVSLGGIGSFVYGLLNRLLIPTGLHHILNNVAWMQIGEFEDVSGKIVQGDLTRFFAQDPTAGMFMTGFFPVMMFGLPAAALAIIVTAQPERRKFVASIMISAGLASFLTGITEPLEFAFMFAAPILYGIHALLTGFSMLIVHLLNIKIGFGFSAGMIDLLLNWTISTNPMRLFLVGIAYFFIYYFVFVFVIRMFNLKTLGREETAVRLPSQRSLTLTHLEQKAAHIATLVGGMDNILNIDACITRLRLTLDDDKTIDEQEIGQLGAHGIIRLGRGNVHFVFGTDSELIKDALLKIKSDT